MEQFQNFLSMMSGTINMCTPLPITTWITISWMPYAFIKRWAWEYSQFLLSLRFSSRLQAHGSQQQQAVGSCSFNNKLWLVAPGCKTAPSAAQGPGGWERTQGFHLIAGLCREMHQSLSRPFAVGDTTLSWNWGIGFSHLLRPIHFQQTISSLAAESGRRARRPKKKKKEEIVKILKCIISIYFSELNFL